MLVPISYGEGRTALLKRVRRCYPSTQSQGKLYGAKCYPRGAARAPVKSQGCAIATGMFKSLVLTRNESSFHLGLFTL